MNAATSALPTRGQRVTIKTGKRAGETHTVKQAYVAINGKSYVILDVPSGNRIWSTRSVEPAEETEIVTFMSCPRSCGVDVRFHHSTDQVNGGCDTGPMSASDMRDWFELRGAGQPGCDTVAESLAEHYGKTEAELDAEYDAICGWTA